MGHTVSDIQNYFKYIIQKHEAVTVNPPIRIHANKNKSISIFNTKKWYYLELLTSETIKLFGSTGKR